MQFALVYHLYSLVVVVRDLELDDVGVRVADDGDDEVHEHHEQEEVLDHPDGEGEHDDEERVLVDFQSRFFINCQQVKRLIRVNVGLIAHSNTQDSKEVS